MVDNTWLQILKFRLWNLNFELWSLSSYSLPYLPDIMVWDTQRGGLSRVCMMSNSFKKSQQLNKSVALRAGWQAGWMGVFKLSLRVWYWAENHKFAEQADEHSSCCSGYGTKLEITNLLSKQISTPAVTPGMILSWKLRICWGTRSALQQLLRVWYWAGNHEFAEQADEHSSCCSGYGTELEITNLLSNQIDTPAVALGIVLSRKSQICWATRSALQLLLRV